MHLAGTITLSHIFLVFENAATVECNVAGLPAGARAVHALTALAREDGIDGCTLVADRGWTASGDLILECERLAPGLPIRFAQTPPASDAMAISGEAFVAALARRHGAASRDDVLFALVDARLRPARPQDALRRASRDILTATGKGGDGIVSRYLNRPISRAISGQLLKIRGFEPSHASIGTALLGLCMALALVFGGQAGLIAGAVLFQAASIFDGVDGEMARATYRTSKFGAALDSAIDAGTNLAFLLGVTINVALAGDTLGAGAGGIALVTLAAGLALIGRRARATRQPLNFDVVKGHFRQRDHNIVMDCLIHLTMRDFYALACALLILAGLTHFVLVAFATVALGWFAVTTFVLARSARKPDAAKMPGTRSDYTDAQPSRSSRPLQPADSRFI